MFCRKCGKEIPDDSEFCPKCGIKTKLEETNNDYSKARTCPKCGKEIHSSSTKYCPYCSSALFSESQTTTDMPNVAPISINRENVPFVKCSRCGTMCRPSPGQTTCLKCGAPLKDAKSDVSGKAASGDTTVKIAAAESKPSSAISVLSAPLTSTKDKPASKKTAAITCGVIVAVVIVLLAILIPVLIVKNKEAHSEFEYHLLEDDTYMIDRYLADDPNVIIPATINKKPVIAINKRAFYDSDIQSVVIAGSVIEIGESAFENCGSLKSLEILPHDDFMLVTSIGNNAFSHCSSLENVILPSNNITKIGAEAFFRCTSLKRIELMSIESVGNKAFSESGLQSVNLHTGDTDPAIFANCKGLKEVTLGNFVDISDKMFMGCSNLETVTWDFSPYMDNKIGNKAFYDCTSLKQFNLAGVFTVTYPKGINECIADLKELGAKDVVIGTDAFMGCDNFKDSEPVTPPKPIVPKATLNTNNVTVNEDGQYMTVPFKTNVSFDSKTKYYLRIYFSNTEGKIGELRYDEPFDTSEKSLDLKLHKGMNCYTIQFYSDEAIGEYSNTIEWYYEPIIKPKIQRYTHTFTVSGYSEYFEIIPDYTIAEEAIQRGEEPEYFEFQFKYTCPRCGTTSLHNGFYRMKYSSDGMVSVMGHCTKYSCSSIPGIAVSIDYHAVKVS